MQYSVLEVGVHIYRLATTSGGRFPVDNSPLKKNALKSNSSYHEETSDEFKVIFLFDSESN